MSIPSPIKLVVGDDWVFSFALKDSDGFPIDLTGFSVGGDIVYPGGRLGMEYPSGSATLADQTTLVGKGRFTLKLFRVQTVNCPVMNIKNHLRVYLTYPNGDKQSFNAWPIEVEDR